MKSQRAVVTGRSAACLHHYGPGNTVRPLLKKNQGLAYCRTGFMFASMQDETTGPSSIPLQKTEDCDDAPCDEILSDLYKKNNNKQMHVAVLAFRKCAMVCNSYCYILYIILLFLYYTYCSH